MNTMTTKQKDIMKTGSVFSIKSIAVMGVLSAVATVLMYFAIPLWFAPPFYKIDFSEVPVIIGALALGPIAGVMIELVKVLLNLVLFGTQTMGVGEFANFLIGCAFVVPAAVMYKVKKSRKSAILGLVTGTAGMTIVGSILNAFVLLPAYSYFMGIPIESLVKMGTDVNANINNIFTLVFFAVVPFNLLKGAAVSVITIILYKRLSIIIKSITK